MTQNNASDQSQFVLGAEFRSVPHQVKFEAMADFERVIWDRGLTSHNDRETARRAGMSGPIASGQVQMAFAHELLEELFGTGWTNGGSIHVRYIKPVFPGDEITCVIRIVDLDEPGDGTKYLRLEIWCEDANQVRTAGGSARVRVVAAEDGPSAHGALQGLRAVELTHAWAGPYCGMMLADMGADVIRVQKPELDKGSRGGYPYSAGESVPSMMLNRGKRSVALDLTRPDGYEAFVKLIASADILVTNFRPDAIRRLRADYDTVSAINPRLVYASISAFAPRSARWRDGGVNMTAQAITGLAWLNGAEPRPLGTALTDMVAGMWTAYGVLCAVIERERTGRGQSVRGSLVQAGLSLMHSSFAMHLYAAGAQDSDGRRFDGNAPSGYFPTADGQYVAVFASYPALWQKFVSVMGLEELAKDPRYQDRDVRTRNARQLHEDLKPIFAEKQLDYWLETLLAAGIPVAPVNSIPQVLADIDSMSPGLMQVTRHPVAGTLPVIGVPVELSRTPGVAGASTPGLGDDNGDILSELGIEGTT